MLTFLIGLVPKHALSLALPKLLRKASIMEKSEMLNEPLGRTSFNDTEIEIEKIR